MSTWSHNKNAAKNKARNIGSDDNPADFNPIEFLLLDDSLENTQNMLTRKVNILQKKYGYLPADDLSILRIKF